MKFGFELPDPTSREAARSKRPSDDVPVQEPMRGSGLRRKPTSDQKKVRRQIQRGQQAAPAQRRTAAEHMHLASPEGQGRFDGFNDGFSGHPKAPASTDPGYLHGYEIGWEMATDPLHEDGYDPQRAASTSTASTATKESTTMSYQQREAEILRQMTASTDLAEQRRLGAELETLRAERTASIQADRDLDLASTAVRDTLTPVAVYERHTAATDWITEQPTGGVDYDHPMRTAATLWVGNLHAAVLADAEEFAEQARGMARREAGRYGEDAIAAGQVFLDTAERLRTKAVQTAEAAGAGPAGLGDRQIDEDQQNGNAESTVTDYERQGDRETFDDDFWAGDDTSGASGVHPPLPGAGEGPQALGSITTEAGEGPRFPYKCPSCGHTWKKTTLYGGETCKKCGTKGEMNFPSKKDSAKTATETSTCKHCGRSIVFQDGRWVDPEATGDDSVWRETCDSHDTFVAEHEPTEKTATAAAEPSIQGDVGTDTCPDRFGRYVPKGKSSAKTAAMPDIDDIMAWENGEMDPDEEATFFQGLIDSGLAWSLQGMYGRRAQDLIDQGVCHTASKTASANYAGPGFYILINGTNTFVDGPTQTREQAQAVIDANAIFKDAYSVVEVNDTNKDQYEFLPDKGNSKVPAEHRATLRTARALHEIAADIKADWGANVNYAAKPYLDAMAMMDSIDDKFGEDQGKWVVAYFLSNAASYRGEKAKALKDELRALQKGAVLQAQAGSDWGRRHYEDIAAALGSLPDGEREQAAKHFAGALSGTNPYYNRSMFEEAASTSGYTKRNVVRAEANYTRTQRALLKDALDRYPGNKDVVRSALGDRVASLQAQAGKHDRCDHRSGYCEDLKNRSQHDTFSLSDAKNEDGEWIMSPEQIRSEMYAEDDPGDAQDDWYDGDYTASRVANVWGQNGRTASEDSGQDQFHRMMVNHVSCDHIHGVCNVPESMDPPGYRTAGTDPNDQNGNAVSGLPQVEVGSSTDTMWPVELPGDSEDPKNGEGAADVAGVPTPGGKSGYPQPKNARLEAFRATVQANLKYCKTCNGQIVGGPETGWRHAGPAEQGHGSAADAEHTPEPGGKGPSNGR